MTEIKYQFHPNLPDAYGDFIFILKDGRDVLGYYDHLPGAKEPIISVLSGVADTTHYCESDILGYLELKTENIRAKVSLV